MLNTTREGYVMTQMIARSEITTACKRCDAPVIATVDSANRRKILNPTPIPGGLYALDSRGKATRRSLVLIADEYRRDVAVHGGGYAAHTCGLPKRLD